RDLARHVASAFIDRPRHPPRRRFGTTSALESACLAVVLARTIEDGCSVVHRRAGRGERLAARAGVDIALMVISELLAREGAVVADRLIEHAHMSRRPRRRARPDTLGPRGLRLAVEEPSRPRSLSAGWRPP